METLKFYHEQLIPPKEIPNMIDFHEDTQRMFWKHRDRKWFNCERSYDSWNTRLEGKECFTSKSKHGYLRASLIGKKILKHRVCWVFYYGVWPASYLDHINGDKTDNSRRNLREVNSIGNARNMSLSSANTSGYTGVYKAKTKGFWRAGITLPIGYKSLGVFDNLEDAQKAREQANKEYGFHEQHGKSRNP